jgi:hypothetical protein
VAKAPSSKAEELGITPVHTAMARFYIVGNTPLICNSMAAKAQRTLLLPSGRRTTAADRAGSLKHDPLKEYRDSVKRVSGNAVPTRIVLPSTAFKGACCTAALDLPGTKKTEIGRLVWVEGATIDVYGVPQILLSVVRTADMAHTPDIRSRAILPEWCCSVTMSFVRPKLSGQGLANLLGAAGILCGVGDFRQEKGRGSYGRFGISGEPTEKWKRIAEAGGREAQDAALEHPVCHDDETEELLGWFVEEIERLELGGKLSAGDLSPELEEEGALA